MSRAVSPWLKERWEEGRIIGRGREGALRRKGARGGKGEGGKKIEKRRKERT